MYIQSTPIIIIPWVLILWCNYNLNKGEFLKLIFFLANEWQVPWLFIPILYLIFFYMSSIFSKYFFLTFYLYRFNLCYNGTFIYTYIVQVKSFVVKLILVIFLTFFRVFSTLVIPRVSPSTMNAITRLLWMRLHVYYECDYTSTMNI